MYNKTSLKHNQEWFKSNKHLQCELQQPTSEVDYNSCNFVVQNKKKALLCDFQS